MAAVCWVWGLTPSDYWALTVAERAALIHHANRVAERSA